ncbi:MAG: hypothetical protein EKK55_24310 [Rhodocyclaceae bacterium]|nr:MAG: hypothetical protein EKK55_24310 [Rhodocyclaceae bacterium]
MIKLRLGREFLFRWQAPAPVTSDPAPVLAVYAGEAEVEGIDALTRAVAPSAITAIGDDRKRLTIAADLLDAEATRCAGEGWGEAFVVAPGGGVFPVRIGRIVPGSSGATVDLTEPLPRSVPATAASLEWASWWTLWTAATVTGTARRDLTWSVAWRPLLAGSAAGEAAVEVDDGVAVVVVRPFATGLTPASLGGVFPDLAVSTPGRDNSRAGVIAAAEAQLVLDLAPHLGERGLVEDDVDGRRLHLAHAHLAAAMIVDRTDPERAERLRALYADQLARGLRAVWVDLDRDGRIDQGEAGGRLTGATAITFGARRLGRAARAATFRRGMGH